MGSELYNETFLEKESRHDFVSLSETTYGWRNVMRSSILVFK